MKKKYFYSLMRDGKFINSNSMKEDTDKISEAIRFDDEEAIKSYWNKPYTKALRASSNIKAVEVECIIREYDL